LGLAGLGIDQLDRAVIAGRDQAAVTTVRGAAIAADMLHRINVNALEAIVKRLVGKLARVPFSAGVDIIDLATLIFTRRKQLSTIRTEAQSPDARKARHPSREREFAQKCSGFGIPQQHPAVLTSGGNYRLGRRSGDRAHTRVPILGILAALSRRPVLAHL